MFCKLLACKNPKTWELFKILETKAKAPMISYCYASQSNTSSWKLLTCWPKVDSRSFCRGILLMWASPDKLACFPYITINTPPKYYEIPFLRTYWMQLLYAEVAASGYTLPYLGLASHGLLFGCTWDFLHQAVWLTFWGSATRGLLLDVHNQHNM